MGWEQSNFVQKVESMNLILYDLAWLKVRLNQALLLLVRQSDILIILQEHLRSLFSK